MAVLVTLVTAAAVPPNVTVLPTSKPVPLMMTPVVPPAAGPLVVPNELMVSGTMETGLPRVAAGIFPAMSKKVEPGMRSRRSCPVPVPAATVTVQVKPPPLSPRMLEPEMDPLTTDRLKSAAEPPSTGLSKETVKEIVLWLVGPGVDGMTVAIGAIPSITRALLKPSEKGPPDTGRVRSASTSPASLMVPPLRVNAPVPV